MSPTEQIDKQLQQRWLETNKGLDIEKDTVFKDMPPEAVVKTAPLTLGKQTHYSLTLIV